MSTAPEAPSIVAAQAPPAPPPPELVLLREWFREWYLHSPIPMPSRFGKREFGFLFFDRPGMVRHLRFSSRASLQRYVQRRVPMHAYYSTAYYTTPSARTMPEKGWLGADLIFDLDADHLRGAETMDIPQMFQAVKVMTIRLLEEFLLKDFGFTEKDLTVTFSGGRGYHIHVHSPAVQSLGSHERREIVDYILGTDLIEDQLIHHVPVAPAKEGLRPRHAQSLRLPDPAEGGWGRKVTEACLDFLTEVEERGIDLGVTRLTGVLPDLKAKEARDLLVHFYSGTAPNRPVDMLRNERRLDLGTKAQQVLVAFAKTQYAIKTGETDAPVTSDIKRLIRLPGSLHGKSGLRVMAVTLKDLPTFDPLQHAVALPIEGPEVEVEFLRAEAWTLGGRTYTLLPGKRMHLPVAAAAFALGRRSARLPRAAP